MAVMDDHDNVEQMYVETPIEAIVIGDDIWWSAEDTYECPAIHVRTFRVTRSKLTREVIAYVVNGDHVLTPGLKVVRRRKFTPRAS